MRRLKKGREERKPVGFRPGSVKGREQAIISGAIKKCREKGTAYFTLHNQRFKIKSPNIADNPACGYLGKFLVRSKWGVQIKDVIFDGNRFYYEYTRKSPLRIGRERLSYGRRYFDEQDIMAEIIK